MSTFEETDFDQTLITHNFFPIKDFKDIWTCRQFYTLVITKKYNKARVKAF